MRNKFERNRPAVSRIDVISSPVGARYNGSPDSAEVPCGTLSAGTFTLCKDSNQIRHGRIARAKAEKFKLFNLNAGERNTEETAA